jgi:hypothetical protein
MPIFLYSDNARSTLGASLSVGGTTITLASGGGALFPNPAPGQQFALTLNDLATQTVFETVWCTARAGDVLTVLRAQEGTAALAWSTGDYVWNGPTAGQMQNMVQTPHMTDASISPVFGPTQVQGTFSATGAATFSTTGQFGSTVSAVDPSTGTLSGVTIASTGSGTQGARLALQGSPGSTGTPNKWLRAQGGIFDILNSNYSAQILTLSDLGDLGAIRNITASGSAAFTGSVTSSSFGSFTDTGTNNGLFVNGSGSNGANVHLHTSNGDKYLRTLNNSFNIVNAAYTQSIFTLDDAGNFGVTGGGNVNGQLNASVLAAVGAVTGQTVSSNNGNITANNGRLRAGFGARGSGDPNAGVILSDFVQGNVGFNPNFVILPDGFIIQFGQATSSAALTAYALPIAFPNFFASVVACEGGVNGWSTFNPPNQTMTVIGTQIIGGGNNTFFVTAGRIFFNNGVLLLEWEAGITFNWIAMGW